MIDVDCHACGTLEGATQFAEYLKRNYFPNLYIETSTHGNGLMASSSWTRASGRTRSTRACSATSRSG